MEATNRETMTPGGGAVAEPYSARFYNGHRGLNKQQHIALPLSHFEHRPEAALGQPPE